MFAKAFAAPYRLWMACAPPKYLLMGHVIDLEL